MLSINTNKTLSTKPAKIIGENQNNPNSEPKNTKNRFLKLVQKKSPKEFELPKYLSIVPEVLYVNSGLRVTTP